MWVTHTLFCVTHARCRFEFDMLSRELSEGNHSLEKRYPTRLERNCGSCGAAGESGAAGVGHSLEKRYQTKASLKDYVLLIDC